MAEELVCGKRKELNPDAKPASDEAFGNTPPAARANASVAAENAAVEAARAAGKEYTCPESCPVRRFEFTIDKPAVAAPALDPVTNLLYKTSAKCKWKCTLSCVEALDKQPPLGLQYQDFVCSDDFTRIFEGEVTASIIEKQPVGLMDQAALVAKLLRDLYGSTTMQIREALAAVRCPHQCKNKRVHVWIWPDASAPRLIAGPDKNGWCTFTMTGWARIDAKCDD